MQFEAHQVGLLAALPSPSMQVVLPAGQKHGLRTQRFAATQFN